MEVNQPRGRWSELNDPGVVDEMLKDKNSVYWERSREYALYYLNKQFLNLSLYIREEVAQETVWSVYKNLSTFRRDCKFTTWLVRIARSRAIDVLRYQKKTQEWEIYHDDLPIPPESKKLEELVLPYEKRIEILAAIEEFLKKRRNTVRNKQIIQMVFFDGLSQKEAGQKLGVPAHVITSVVYFVRGYLRKNFPDIFEGDK